MRYVTLVLVLWLVACGSSTTVVKGDEEGPGGAHNETGGRSSGGTALAAGGGGAPGGALSAFPGGGPPLVSGGSPPATGGASAAGAGSGAAPSTGGSPPAWSRVFVTDATFTLAEFDGPLTADLLCQQAAEAAGLGSTWRAYLSKGTTNAPDRLVDVSPWHRMDGELAFATHEQLSLWPDVPIDVTELGVPLATTQLGWTGTFKGVARYDCNGWDASPLHDGRQADLFSTADWDYRAAGGYQRLCAPALESNHLFCFEQ